MALGQRAFRSIVLVGLCGSCAGNQKDVDVPPPPPREDAVTAGEAPPEQASLADRKAEWEKNKRNNAERRKAQAESERRYIERERRKEQTVAVREALDVWKRRYQEALRLDVAELKSLRAVITEIQDMVDAGVDNDHLRVLKAKHARLSRNVDSYERQVRITEEIVANLEALIEALPVENLQARVKRITSEAEARHSEE